MNHLHQLLAEKHCQQAVPTVELDSMLASLSEILYTDLFFQEAWDLPNVWVQLQEENKTFGRVEKCIFKRFLNSLIHIS